MNKIKLTIWSLLASSISLAFSACSSGHEKKQKESVGLKVNATKITVEQTKKIIQGYLNLKNALIETNGEAAQSFALEILELIPTAEDTLSILMLDQATHISKSNNPELQRYHFKLLSEHVYNLAKINGKGNNNLYRQHCSMAFDNKGAYWLSEEESINNPYFGDKMLHCGGLEEKFN